MEPRRGRPVRLTVSGRGIDSARSAAICAGTTVTSVSRAVHTIVVDSMVATANANEDVAIAASRVCVLRFTSWMVSHVAAPNDSTHGSVVNNPVRVARLRAVSAGPADSGTKDGDAAGRSTTG